MCTINEQIPWIDCASFWKPFLDEISLIDNCSLAHCLPGVQWFVVPGIYYHQNIIKKKRFTSFTPMPHSNFIPSITCTFVPKLRIEVYCCVLLLSHQGPISRVPENATKIFCCPIIRLCPMELSPTISSTGHRPALSKCTFTFTLTSFISILRQIVLSLRSIVGHVLQR